MSKTFFCIGMLLSSLTLYGQRAPVVDLLTLEEHLNQKDAEVHIVNFWATWCGPCVKELPYFDAITNRRDRRVQVTLVSMDLDLNPDPERVRRFVEARGIQSRVLLLDEADPYAWILRIDSTWSGALPATLILNHKTGQRTFIERALQEGELEQYLPSIP